MADMPPGVHGNRGLEPVSSEWSRRTREKIKFPVPTREIIKFLVPPIEIIKFLVPKREIMSSLFQLEE